MSKRYTRGVLTVITVCLLWLSAVESPLGVYLLPSAEAQSGVVYLGGIRFNGQLLSFDNRPIADVIKGLPVLNVK